MIGEFVLKAAEPGPNDRVLILAEQGVMGQAILEIQSALQKAAPTTLLVYPDKGANQPNYPEFVKAAMEQSSIILDCCASTDMYSGLKQELLEGRKLVYLLKPCGRFLDYYRVDKKATGRIKKLTEQTRAFLQGSKEIEAAIGNSTFTAKIGGRPIIIDGFEAASGTDTILPPASVSFAPLEDSLDGSLEFSGFVENVSGSLRAEKLSGQVEIASGRIIGCPQGMRSFFKEFDTQVLTIGHITFGTNPFIRAPLEGFDTERSAGGICLGFGNNQGTFQGENSSNGHIDLAMKADQIVLKNESGKKLVIGGGNG